MQEQKEKLVPVVVVVVVVVLVMETWQAVYTHKYYSPYQ